MNNQQKGQAHFLVLSLLVFVLTLSTVSLLVDKFAPSLLTNNSGNSVLSSKQSASIKEEIKKTIDQYYLDSTSDVDYNEGEVRGLVSALEDPYTEYLSEEDYSQFTEALNEEYVGIGIRFSNKVEGFLVEEVMKGSPAKSSGVLEGDYIFKIEDTPTYQIPFDDIANRIRGERNTNVNLTFLRDGEEIDKTIARREIQVEQLTLEIQDNVAVIAISSFGEDLDKEMESIIDQINEQNIDNVVLDLRSNGGGLLQEAIEITSYFMDEGETVLIEKTKDDRKVFETVAKPASLKDKEIVVLVNRYSASASEIVAGALKDNQGALIVGEKTFGKGVVQRIFPLSNGGVLKLTIAEWLTPNETTINAIGLSPDVTTSPEDDPLELAIEQFDNT